ncbi:3-oxoacyl-ACP reductase family protein [Devosia ginsengisoli]|uniref:3-oxoacyl-ACP reductase family protein n=1 Tax=Devosia ginsengisoli TaxID=400770 RepID=UPI0026F0A498|nr:3-oxoacyl-ACP reductase family protein [Devosia ginsengisoli]MCR6670389.1 3-oxoacyl-ACP reductase FabG [Devosia ginsengisoli]
MTSPNSPFSGKRALVTGGSRGIGAAIVRRLAADGAQVALTYSASPDAAAAVVREIEANGGSALAIKADSGDVAQLQVAVNKAAEQMGGLDILVNNAGVMVFAPFDEMTATDFDRAINVNVRGMYFAAQAAARHMQPGGRIINIGSNTAVKSTVAGSSVYTLSKTAVAGMTRALAHDLGPRGITINNVQPGPTVTDMNPADGPRAAWILAQLPVGRMGDAAEIAGLVSYLAGPQSGYMTGASLTMDGGMST